MAQSRMSGTDIINTVLARIGNDTIVLEAQTELQNIINRLNEDFKWPFNRVMISGSVSGSTITLPADFVDFWDKTSFSLFDSSDSLIPTAVIPQQSYELSDSLNVSGTPFRVYHDIENGTLILDSTPSSTLTYRLFYRSMPAQITDFDTVVNFPNDSLLIQLLFAWACQFEDDDRYERELAVADKMQQRYFRRFGISASINSRAALNPTTFNRIINFR